MKKEIARFSTDNMRSQDPLGFSIGERSIV